MSVDRAGAEEVERVLAAGVYLDGANRRFGDLSAEQAAARAAELRAAVGWGPTARVAPVAAAWRELAQALYTAQAETVAELPGDVLLGLAPRLWVVLPG